MEDAEASVSVSPRSHQSNGRYSQTGATIADPASVVEHGRTYHGYREGKYFFPNDGVEQIRLDLQHRLWKTAMDEALSWAPLGGTELANVLDIGTGTGAWATEFAEQHPESQVFGSDLSMIQPLYVPPNCTFVREDSEEEWVYSFNFDYIHLRLMFSCFSDYKTMVKTVFDHLRPGGWVEYQEFSLEAIGMDEFTQNALRNDHTAYQGWMNYMKDGSSRLGRDIDVTPKLRGWLLEAGFVDVVEKRILAPISAWSSDAKEKEIGRLHAKNLFDAVTTTAKMLHAAGMSEEEVQDYVASYRKNLEDLRLKIYHPWTVVFGRKPYAGEAVGKAVSP